jgi:AcrR family transcriptional regulator
MTGPDETAPAGAQQSLRELRLAGREAIRQARESGRERARHTREELRQVVREVRDTEREAARAMRAASREARDAGRIGEADTRSRIQDIAIELFTEQGYEATSLREIAERLGVTKAALYYHFRTKDDIIASLVEECGLKIEELIAWAERQPRTLETRLEFVRRYSALLFEGGQHRLMRCLERNQPAMHQHKAGVMMRRHVLRMLDLLCDREEPMADQIRRSLAIFALHSATFTVRDPEVPDDEHRAAALEVALDLVR